MRSQWISSKGSLALRDIYNFGGSGSSYQMRPYFGPTTSFTSTLAATFIKEIVRLHGFPSSIVLVWNKIFLRIFCKELFQLQETQLNPSRAYHPQSDGQTEIFNKSLETYLCWFINELGPTIGQMVGMGRALLQYIPACFYFHDSLYGSLWEGSTPFNQSMKGSDTGWFLGWGVSTSRCHKRCAKIAYVESTTNTKEPKRHSQKKYDTILWTCRSFIHTDNNHQTTIWGILPSLLCTL